MRWCCVLVIALVAGLGAAPSAQSRPSGDESVEATFLKATLAYVQLRKGARPDARRGDIMTPAVAEHVNTIIRKAFRGQEGRNMRRTIREAESFVLPVLRVNDVLPNDLPTTMMPPTLLRRLPQLPEELQYRIVGFALVLEDMRTSVIVDFIPYAIPGAR